MMTSRKNTPANQIEAVPKRDVNRQEGGDEQRRQNADDQEDEQVENLQVVEEPDRER